ncbi:MAG TPA: PQQ-binding-like beta-propeller repeat protein [Solirubrobacteraceae bacterium]|nr:PQQ-binding-like beta-propeller repeat protein [Solirubrobacteraceae bacterium]
MPSPGSRPWWHYALVGVLVLVLAAVAVVIVLIVRKPGNVSHPSVEFTAPSTTATQPPPPPPKKAKPAPFLWPRYGFTAARTRYFNPGHRLGPPLRVGWRFQDYATLEFPPDIYGNRLYFMDDDASAKALDTRTGRKLWEHKIGTLAAASPAIGVKQGLMYVPVLSLSSHSPGDGAIFALSLKDGHTVWQHHIPAGTESSPLAYGNTVYFGDQAGNVYSMQASNGHINWVYHASGAVKGGPAYADGMIFFGDYAGRAYAVNARTGHQVWAVATNGTRYGFGSGNFYSTPAVAFGRVYMGNTDSFVYSFAEHSGRLAWRTGTGAYVYASPAVADPPGLGPTVFMGSYDGNFYAFDARSGAVRWRHYDGQRISGSATIVGSVVYYSDLGARTTSGLDVRTGRRVFFFSDGAFNPIVGDSRALYLSGYTMLYELLPRR